MEAAKSKYEFLRTQGKAHRGRRQLPDQKPGKRIGSSFWRRIRDYIVSHNMQDVSAVADRIVVMRRGKKAGERMVKDTNEDEVAGSMVGTFMEGNHHE